MILIRFSLPCVGASRFYMIGVSEALGGAHGADFIAKGIEDCCLAFMIRSF